MQRFLSFSLTLALTVLSSSAETLPILAKARAFVGNEEALRSVTAIHYIGTADETVDDKPQSYAIDMIFAKDFRQRLRLTRPNVIDITALDDYEAWHRLQDPANPAKGRTILYGKSNVKELRAATWENLNFFGDISAISGKVVDDGLTTLGDAQVHRVSFVHELGIVYERYFNPETGQLVLTTTDDGREEIREEGEIRSGGIRFPKKILNTIVDAEGKKRLVTITLENVKVNEPFPESVFAVPLTPPAP